jgi:hypothetical protein
MNSNVVVKDIVDRDNVNRMGWNFVVVNYMIFAKDWFYFLWNMTNADMAIGPLYRSMHVFTIFSNILCRWRGICEL